MAPPKPAPASSAVPSSTPNTPHLPLRCGTCKSPLADPDKKRKGDGYYKHCKTCRDKLSVSRQQRRDGAHKRKASDTAPNVPNQKPRTSKPSKTENHHQTTPPRAHSTPNAPSSPSKHLASETSCNSVKQDVNLPSQLPKQTIHGLSKNDFTIINDSAPGVRKCSVCSESIPIPDFPHLSSCNHTPDVCHNCLLRWLDQEMAATQDIQKIRCPSHCTGLITYQDIQKYTSAEVFNHYNELSLRSFLSTQEDFIYCITPGCSSGQIHDTATLGERGPIFRCVGCGYRMCTAHTPVIPFHENETCAEYDKRTEAEQAQEEASVALLKEKAQKCPGCGSQIEKTTGCDHMTCKTLENSE